MKLLVDNCLSYRIAHALDALFSPHHEIVALRDKFAESAADVTWITALDREGSWAVLTRDLRIRSRPHERRAMDSSAIVYFFLERVPARQNRRSVIPGRRSRTRNRCASWIGRGAPIPDLRFARPG